MGLLGWSLGDLLRRRAARRKAELERRQEIERLADALSCPSPNLETLRAAVRAYPGEPRILRAAAQAARSAGRAEESELLDRASDAPDDPTTCLDLGLHLSDAGALDLAVAVLERAVEMSPFDAVARSELALCLARDGRHARVVEVLALHPCLATDAGALFQFGWSARESGDAATAHAARRQLEELGAHDLAEKLR